MGGKVQGQGQELINHEGTKDEEGRSKPYNTLLIFNPLTFFNFLRVFFVFSVQRSGFVVNGFCGFKVKSDLTTKARRMKKEDQDLRPKK